jgi:undecaprenyl diphosphate synthase
MPTVTLAMDPKWGDADRPAARHVAIIMDGNGRWAQQRRLPRIVGHQQGVETVQCIVRECRQLGIEFLTLYAFSSENWGRPSDEVHSLMGLLGRYLKSELATMLSQGIRLNVIGQIDKLPEPVKKTLLDTVEQTATNQGMMLTLALSYGGRDEIVRAFRKLATAVAAGQLAADQIDDCSLAAALDTGGIPDPDLLIRTSGEMRISNFLLWQIAYSELVFTEVLWPDFRGPELRLALDEYTQRQRRFGLTGEQIYPAEPGGQEESH